MKPIAPYVAGVLLTFGLLHLPAVPVAVDMPTSAAYVWRIANKNGHSASACPVRTLVDGSTLFLTSKHVTKHMGPAGASRAIVESMDKSRKLVIVSFIDCPAADLSLLVVKGDGGPIDLFNVDLVGCSIGDRVYTSGYPGPIIRWFCFSGLMGTKGWHSSRISEGMSGGATVDSAGRLSGVNHGHAYFPKTKGHYRAQGLSVMLHLHKKWLLKVGAIE